MARAGATLTQTFSSVTTTQNLWIIDSGATDHITGFKDLFTEFNDYSKHKQVEVATGQFSKVLGSGTVNIQKISP